MCACQGRQAYLSDSTAQAYMYTCRNVCLSDQTSSTQKDYIFASRSRPWQHKQYMIVIDNQQSTYSDDSGLCSSEGVPCFCWLLIVLVARKWHTLFVKHYYITLSCQINHTIYRALHWLSKHYGLRHQTFKSNHDQHVSRGKNCNLQVEQSSHLLDKQRWLIWLVM